LYKIK